MTAVHNWQGCPTWISRLEEFVQNAQRLSEKVFTNSFSACSFALCFKQVIQKVPSGFYRLFLAKNLGCFSLNLEHVQLYSQTLYET